MHDSVKIRAAEVKDVTILTGFNVLMAQETEDKQLDPGVVTAGVRAVLEDSKRGFYLVSEIAGEVVASLMVTTEWSDWRDGEFWWIQSVYVAPGFRRRGLFGALYGEVRERARNTERVCGCRLYVEQDNDTAQATYARLGLLETDYKMFEDVFR
ncbi:MAG: GNAT family N-acetyltransferase [Desulfobulbaceae bacterium]|uniref:GNAT family N-acetyltransferase n=1 Tax=Candidatus Desulfatifera sulfidica TaxID=2841691 RepID=A0A8J6TB78_9BACT|nr:GNAT family N-acetyltransferase [Candidatus Desulfatifera sulfidica]